MGGGELLSGSFMARFSLAWLSRNHSYAGSSGAGGVCCYGRLGMVVCCCWEAEEGAGMRTREDEEVKGVEGVREPEEERRKKKGSTI
jgi:hypothetical protein